MDKCWLRCIFNFPKLFMDCYHMCDRMETQCPRGVKCGYKVCYVIELCRDPWLTETNWYFKNSTYSPYLQEDKILLTSTPEKVDEVPQGMVQICLKETGAWWNAVTMFKGTEYIKEIVNTQNADGQINCGFVKK